MIVSVMLTRGISMPKYETRGASGVDLVNAENDGIIVEGGDIVTIQTGLRLRMPREIEGQVRIRSSFAQIGLFVVNSPGTIDSDYIGEVGVIVSNLKTSSIVVRRFERFAQLVFAPVIRPNFVEVGGFDLLTERGERGFGSTGAF